MLLLIGLQDCCVLGERRRLINQFHRLACAVNQIIASRRLPSSLNLHDLQTHTRDIHEHANDMQSIMKDKTVSKFGDEAYSSLSTS